MADDSSIALEEAEQEAGVGPFTEEFWSRPSLSLSASLSGFLDMYTYTDWTGYGKQTPHDADGDEISIAEDRDQELYIFPNTSISVSTSCNLVLGAIGGDMAITTFAFGEISTDTGNALFKAQEDMWKAYQADLKDASWVDTPGIAASHINKNVFTPFIKAVSKVVGAGVGATEVENNAVGDKSPPATVAPPATAPLQAAAPAAGAEATEKAAKEAVQGATEKVVAEATQEVATEVAAEAAKEATEAAATLAAKATAEQTAKEAAEQAAKEAAEAAAEAAAKQAAKEAADKLAWDTSIWAGVTTGLALADVYKYDMDEGKAALTTPSSDED